MEEVLCKTLNGDIFELLIYIRRIWRGGKFFQKLAPLTNCFMGILWIHHLNPINYKYISIYSKL